MSNITAYFGETMKSGSGVVATADYSGTTSVAGLYGPTGVGGYASGQFQFVTIENYTSTGSSSASNAGAVIVSTKGQGGVKVLGNKPQQGDPCQLFDIGEVKVVAGAALTIGQLIMSDANGRAIPWVDEEGYVPVGECRVPANSANDICTMFIFPNYAGETSFSAAAVTAVASPGTQLTSVINEITVGASSGEVVLPPAIAGTICLIGDAQEGTHPTTVEPNGSDTIRGSGTGVTSSTSIKTLLFFCAVTGNWDYLLSA
jgi:hypothetical protein